jgi:hypothetical protein
MTENELTPSEKQQTIEIGYATPPTHPTGPSVSDVLGGVILGLLGLFSLAIGIMLSMMAIAIATGSGNEEDRTLPAHSIGPAIVAILCFFGAVVMFRISRRLFGRMQPPTV